MKLEYSLTNQDFINQQLFAATQSPSIVKRRKKSKLLLPILYWVIGLLFLAFGQTQAAIIFIVFAMLWYFLFPLWVRKQYENYYTKFVSEKLQHLVNKPAVIEFTLAKVEGVMGDDPYEFLYENLISIAELPTAFYLYMNNSAVIIVPKLKIDNTEYVQVYFKELASKYSFDYIYMPHWIWK